MASLLPTPEPPDPVEGQPGHFDHTNWVKASLKALDQGTVHSSGGAIANISADSVTVDDSLTQDALVKLKGDGTRGIWSQNAAGVSRWRLLLGDSTVEGGSHGGSLFKLLAYGDDGSVRATVLQADRSSGLATVAGDPTSGKGIATKDYVDSLTIPIGAIIAFGGSTVPAGWHMCDGSAHGSSALQAVLGSANAPDLRGLFIVGAGKNGDATTGSTATYPVGTGSKDGKESVLLSAAQSGLRAHNHSLTTADTNHRHSGTTGDDSPDHTHAIPGYSFALTRPPGADWGGISAGSSYHGVEGYQSSAGPATARHRHAFTTNTQAEQHGSSVHGHTVGTATAADASVAHENRPPYYALVYIIRKV